MRVVLPISVFLCALFVSPVVYAQETELIDRIVAVVGGEVITLSELKKSSKLARDAPLEKMLDKLIDEKLIEIAAREQGVEITDDEVKAAVERHIAQMGLGPDKFKELLKQEGLTMEQYREKIRAELMKVKFVKNNVRSEVKVSEEDVLNYYRRNPDQFRTTEQIRLAHIFLPFPMEADSQEREKVKKLAEKIRALTAGGKDFGSLAKKYSKSSSAPAGGDLGWVGPKDLVPAFKEAITGLEAGKVSKVIELRAGCHLLFVTERKSSGVLPFDNIKEKVERYLFNKKLAEELDKVLSKLKKEIPIEKML